MSINWQRIYTDMGALIASEPEALARTIDHTPEMLQWLGRVEAIVRATNDMEFKGAIMKAQAYLGARGTYHSGMRELHGLMYRVLSVAEYNSPAASAGAFIPVGKPLDAFAIIGRILESAKEDALIVDPYMDDKTLTQFATLIPLGIQIRLLADAQSKKPSLAPAQAMWKQQYDDNRPLEVRLASPRILHDRLIVVDGKDAWSLTQSLNAFAQRSPATILKADAETAQLKIAAFNDIWAAATPLP